MNMFRYADLVFAIAGSIVAPPIIGILIGNFIDNRFQTSPWFTLILLLLGIASGIFSLFKLVKNVASH